MMIGIVLDSYMDSLRSRTDSIQCQRKVDVLTSYLLCGTFICFSSRHLLSLSVRAYLDKSGEDGLIHRFDLPILFIIYY